MWTTVIVILAVLATAGLYVASEVRAPERTAAPPALARDTTGEKPAAPTAVTPLTRAEVEARLEALARSEPPKNLEMGAMCYDMAGPPATADYVCPRCGHRTQYAREGGMTRLLTYELLEMRDQVKALRGLDAILDESELCRKCSPAVKEPQLVLRVRYTEPGGKSSEEHRTRGVTATDLDLLREFTEGKDRHESGQGRGTPLRDHLPRIRELLGIGG